MIELPPQIDYSQSIDPLTQSQCQSVIDDINNRYLYWSSMKYLPLPDGIDPVDVWHLVRVQRQLISIPVWQKYGIRLSVTNEMQRMCHEYDMNFGGSWGAESVLPEENRQKYLVSSLMEEAISSSQMEGANTTRKVAKEMLRKNLSPQDKSQRMIMNNYNTIQFIVSHKDEPLTPELLLEVHGLMTTDTLAPAECGHFRQTDDVVVENGITHEVVHTPPYHEEIPEFVDSLCEFFNSTDSKPFIHPIIRGIIIHFMLAYMHPFADGNGRTARALFYWYLLKQGYWLCEYLSISRIISSSKKSYEKAYLYTEADGNDIGYFVQYNLRVLGLAFRDLQTYIEKKQRENRAANSYLRLGNLNQRQAGILQMFAGDPNLVLTIKDVQIEFLVSPTTAKSDVVGLMDMDLLSEISFNKVKKGYVRGKRFEELIFM